MSEYLFSLNKLWELRKELDLALISGNYDTINNIKLKYKNLTINERKNRVFIGYNHAFWQEWQRDSHIFGNIEAIAKNIDAYKRKYFDGENVSLKLKTQSKTPYLAGEIWVLRAMFDKFIIDSRNVKDEAQVQQNMILGKAICDRLKFLMYMEQTEDYFAELNPIFKEVENYYKNVYGKIQPKINYSQISEDYLEI